MQSAIDELRRHVSEIDAAYLQSSLRPKTSFTGPWRGDEALHSNLEQLKKCAERLSHSCTKFSLLAINNHPESDPAAMESFLSEFMPYIESYLSFYMYSAPLIYI